MTGQPENTIRTANGCNGSSKPSTASKFTATEFMQVLNDSGIIMRITVAKQYGSPSAGNVSRFKIIDSTLREVIFGSTQAWNEVHLLTLLLRGSNSRMRSSIQIKRSRSPKL
jgi:hypothetical protein